MAITAVNLTASTGFTAQSYNTASVSPGANRLLLLACVAGTAGGTNPITPTVTGNGLTWVQVGSVNYDASGTTDRATLFLFRSMGAAPSSGVITIDWTTSVTLANAAWALAEFDGVDTSGTNGSGAVIQPTTNSTIAATSLVVTLPGAFGDAANNAAYGAFSHQNNEATTPGSGFTELADVATGSGGKSLCLQTEWRLGEDLTVDASWTTSNRPGGIAVEIKAVVVAAGDRPLQRREPRGRQVSASRARFV